ncbi:hypothetical protein ACEN4E_05680 [Latilactobacillus sakei]|uniref:hypothetical protein n=1 Tax=Latilactobacillus sakei TaxID=1599 RepID=UPI00388AB965
MEKKKFFKSIWFWLFIVAAVLGGFFMHDALVYSDQNDSLIAKNKKLVKENKQYKQLFTTLSGGSSSNSDESNDSSEKESVYGLNEESILAKNGTDKMYGIKITQADQNFNDHGKTLVGQSDMGASMNLSQDKGLQVTADYTNYGLSDPFLASTQYFTVYDDEGKTVEMLSQQDGQDEVTEDHTGTTHFWVNLNKPVSQTKYIEIEYKDGEIGGVSKFKIELN